MILMILPFEVMLSAGAVIKDQGLAGTQNMYINPLFPPRCLGERERVVVCAEFESSPTLRVNWFS